jgi:hypothetical protein
MPAVSLNRLKTQIAGLAWKFTSPDDFRRAVRDLFELYADRAYRAGEVVQAERKALAYHSPPLVLRQLELELARHIQENPEAALSAADALWQDEYLELRLVAAFLLGQAPVDNPQPVLKRLIDWCQAKEDRQALDGLLDRGSERLRREQPERWFELIQDWLNQGGPSMTAWRCAPCCPPCATGSSRIFPPIYQVIGPLLSAPTAAVQSNLFEVLKALARRSPVETAYFLRQAVSLNPNPAVLRSVRRAMTCRIAFPQIKNHNLFRRTSAKGCGQ